MLKKLEKNGESIGKVRKEFKSFYERCLSYLDLWKENFEQTEDFVRLNSGDISWPSVKQSAVKINQRIGKQVVNIDKLFYEVVIAKSFGASKADIWATQNFKYEEKWQIFFAHCNERHILVKNLCAVVEYILCLPVTSEQVERVFL